MKIILTVEAELEDEEIFDIDKLYDDVMGDWVKVKSGPYDNALTGQIIGVDMPDNTEETRKNWKAKGSKRVL